MSHPASSKHRSRSEWRDLNAFSAAGKSAAVRFRNCLANIDELSSLAACGARVMELPGVEVQADGWCALPPQRIFTAHALGFVGRIYQMSCSV